MYYLVFVNDVSNSQTMGLQRIQKYFQTTFTNALSHERMTPLNSMINCSELMLNKCEILKANTTDSVPIQSKI
jgi:hypothetical protein